MAEDILGEGNAKLLYLQEALIWETFDGTFLLERAIFLESWRLWKENKVKELN